MNRPRKTSCLVATAAAACLGWAIPAGAQEKAYRFEITPYAAYRMGGSFDEKDGDGSVDINDSSAEGIMFNIAANRHGQYELIYARQSTDADTSGFVANDPTVDLDIEQFQFGGTYFFDGNNTRPFIALTLGVTQFDPQLAGTDSESYFSASFGGGVHLRARKRLGIRLEARVFTTFIDDDSNIFCSSVDGSGTCLVRVAARTLSQWEARAGLVFRF